MNGKPTTRRRLVVLQLNELNFDLVARYLESHELPHLRRMMSTFTRVDTFAEEKYEEIEPWIQWISAHSGKTYREHRIFRLGDAAGSRLPQVFELLEQRGLKVGAISPMNARNELRQPAYFIPDPWTDTECDGSPFSRRLTEMLRQTVNDNAHGHVTKRSVLTFAEATLRSFRWNGTFRLLRMIVAARERTWTRAVVLDQLIHLVHLHLWQRHRPDVSFVFMNAGAHVQHHYYFNSPFANTASRNPAWYVAAHVDPVLDMIRAYDRMLGDYLALCDEGTRLIVATGLTQIPYDRVKFYYRLKDHAQFLHALGITTAQPLLRMTRDFEIRFDDVAAARHAAATLRSVRMQRDGLPLFGEIEERGAGLFVTLTYPHEVLPTDSAVFDGGTVPNLLQQLAFVALKNGMHSTQGYAYFSPESTMRLPAQPVHVASLFQLTLDAAGV